MSDAQVLKIERIEFIPPRGILEQLVDVVKRKYEKKETRFIKGFKVPSERFRFDIDLIVDDDCEICPYAVEVVGELTSMYSNVYARVWNMSYVEPPYKPNATPFFIINRGVGFAGIPVNPDETSRFLMKKLKDAYVKTHPHTRVLLDKIRTFSEINGYVVTPNIKAFNEILYKLLRNVEKYGYPYCPCRPLVLKPGMSEEEIYELNKDKVCPCRYAIMEVPRKGHCLCGLFWSKEEARKYVENRAKRYAQTIEMIRALKKKLDELEKYVIRGGAKEYFEERLLNDMQVLYALLPDD